MAFDAYIQITEIAGEALDEQFTNWIEIAGYKFGVNQSTSNIYQKLSAYW
jgi:type VI secretion system secreted protein Hcp